MGDVTAGIAVDLDGHVPPFEQVRAQIAELIATGGLLPGDQLPTVRALAADLGLASNTVARAYKALEVGGLVEAHSRAGTRVATGEHTAEVVASLAEKFASAAHGAGLSDTRAIEIVRTALRAQASPRN
jgi:GntR family transcriptional regulator